MDSPQADIKREGTFTLIAPGDELVDNVVAAIYENGWQDETLTLGLAIGVHGQGMAITGPATPELREREET